MGSGQNYASPPDSEPASARRRGSLNRDRLCSWSSKQPRHLYHGGIENVEEELGRDADGEHEKGGRDYYPLLVRPELGKSDTGFDERAAEKRLHYAHKHNGGEKETDYRHRGKRGSNSEGTLEDEKFADK